jgi:putative membrane protein
MLLFSKGMEYLINHHHSRVYHFIIGIVAASTVLILVPNPKADESISYAGSDWMTLILSIVLFALGAWLGLWMSKLEDKYK